MGKALGVYELLRGRPATWIVAAGWLALAAAIAPAASDAVADASGPVRSTVAVLCWGAWAGGLIATLVPSPLSLTVLRIAAPAAVVVVVVASARDGADPVAAVVSVAVAVGVATPRLGEEMVDASSYGREQRVPLRVPGPLLLGPIWLAWAVVVAGIGAGPLLLAARSWLLGAVALAVGWPAAGLAARALHQLSRRWLVFVPAGVVVHDPLALVDAVLCRRATTESLGPALAGTTATDVSLGSLGTPLELRLTEPVSILPVRRGSSPIGSVETSALLFGPTRPGHALAVAAAQGFRTRSTVS